MRGISFSQYFHIALAFALLPIQQFMPEAIKLLLLPYLFYLIWAKNPDYFPALIVWATPGTTISYGILLITLLMSFQLVNLIKRYHLLWLYLLCLLPLPIFLYMTGVRVFSMGMGLVETLKPLGFYLAIFPFFYGLGIGHKVKNRHLMVLMVTIFSLPLFRFLPMVDWSIRPYWFAFPLFFAVIFSVLFVFPKMRYGWKAVLLSFCFLPVALLSGLKMTLIFSATVTACVIISTVKNWKWVRNALTRPRLVLIFVSVVVLSIAFSRDYSVTASNRIDKDQLSYFDPSEFWTLFKYKAFDDRAVLWSGGWKYLEEEWMVWPAYELNTYSFKTNRGDRISDVGYGMHNIGLELMRNYGFMIGGLLTILYFLFLVRGPGKYIREHSQNSPISILFASTCLGVGIVGALVGQFVLMITFSFLLMGLTGVFVSIGITKAKGYG